MKNISMAVPVLAFALLGTAGVGLAQQGYPQQAPPPQQQGYPQQQPGYGPPPQGQSQGQPGYGDRGHGWDAPPNEFREFARQGFRDGMDGARRDLENHRRPNPNNRDEYRHPNVPREVRRDYKMGFARGYNVAMQHAFNGGPPQRPY